MAGAWMVAGRPCGLCSVAVELQTIERKEIRVIQLVRENTRRLWINTSGERERERDRGDWERMAQGMPLYIGVSKLH